MRIALALLLMLWFALPAAARDGAGNGRTQAGPAGVATEDEILLADGTVLSGHIVAETDSTVTIETASLGRMELPRAQIHSLHRAGERYGLREDPDANSILLTPTPATVGKGDAYFRSFELLVLNAGFGITDRLDFSAAGLFPITADWNFLALGLKLCLLDRRTQPIGLALTGSHLIAPDEQRFSSFGGVVGIGDAHRSANLALDYTVDEDGDSGHRVMIGGDLQISGRNKVFVEWANSQLVFSGGDADSDEFDGFITFGWRVFGDRMAFTLGGIRPLVADTGDFIALPMIMFSVH